jgi:hypothetical protein
MARIRPKRTVELQPPIGGQVTAYAYQNPPIFTTPLCVNVRPYDVSEMRARIGTRPGLEKAFAANIGAGEVRMIATVNWISSNNLVNTLVVSAAGVTKYSASNGTLAAVVVSGGAAISSTQLIHAVELSQVLYIGDWDPDATISGAARVPKTYTPSTNTLAALTASAGTVPKGCPAIARYRGRIVLAGARANPHVASACRINDATDWDAAGADVDDQTRPWSIGAGDAFTVGQPITALIPTNDQCMIIACTNSLYILRNDPASGGSLNMIDADIGIVSHGAWCYTPGGAIVFLSHNGLYMSYGGCADHRVESLSRERLPLALLNLGTSNKIVNLAFDTFANGVHIMVSPTITPYNTGTIAIVNGVVTLTGGTWPSGAADDRLLVNGETYDVATRDSGTQLTLGDLTVNVGGGTSYSLFRATTAAEHYFFDWKSRGFWPCAFDWKNETTAIHAWKNFAASGTYDTAYAAELVAYSTNAHPTSIAHSLVANESTVLLGCRDGYIRWFRTDATTDDSNAIESYLVYGPLGFGRGMYDCTLDAIHGTLANESGDIRWTIYAGSSPESALLAPTREQTDVWTGEYLSQWAYPRVLGTDFYVKLSDVDGSVWTIERVGLWVNERGLSRG